jgi:hypothetical protein
MIIAERFLDTLEDVARKSAGDPENWDSVGRPGPSQARRCTVKQSGIAEAR